MSVQPATGSYDVERVRAGGSSPVFWDPDVSVLVSGDLRDRSSRDPRTHRLRAADRRKLSRNYRAGRSLPA
jgi:hypothetical protein